MQDTIEIKIPVKNYGSIATAAALEGLDINRWLANKIIDTFHPAPAAPPVIESPEPPTLPKWQAPAQEPEFDINSVTFTECIPSLPQ